MRKYALLFCLLWCCSLLLSQEGMAAPANPDSLRNAIAECPPDIHKVSLMVQLAKQLKWAEPEEALSTAKEAGELALELGDADAWTSARLAEASILTNRGDFDQAEANLQEVLSTNEHFRKDEHIGSVLFQLGIVAYSQSDYPKAIDYYERALEFLTKEDRIGSCHNNLALAYRAEGNVDAYLSNMFAALDRFEKLNAPLKQAYVLNNLAVFYNSLGEPEKALSYSQASLDLLPESENPEARVAYLATLGGIYEAQGEAGKALQAFRESVSLARNLGLQHELGVGLNNIGNYYLDMKRYSQAEIRFTEAMDIFHEIGYTRGKASVASNMARMYKLQGKINDAIEYQHLAMDMAKEDGELTVLAQILENLANLYEEGGYTNYALQYRKEYEEVQDEILNGTKIKEMARAEAERELALAEKEAKIEEQKRLLLQEARRRQRQPWTWILIGLGVLFVLGMALLIILRSNMKSIKQRNFDLSMSLARVNQRLEEMQSAQPGNQKVPQGVQLPPEFDTLSKREIEVFICLANGMTNKAIAGKLHISVDTVRSHAKNIYSKLGVRNRTMVMKMAHTYGLG